MTPVTPTNSHTTLPPGHRGRGGHRYRPDGEPFQLPVTTNQATHHRGFRAHSANAPSETTSHAEPLSSTSNNWNSHNSWSQEPMGHTGWHTPTWSPEESWTDGGAWTDSWETPRNWGEQDWTAEPEERAWPADSPTDSAEEPRADDEPSHTATTTPRRKGAHRVPAPPNALKGRAAVAAVAAGAFVAAGQCALTNGESEPVGEYTAGDQVHHVAAQSTLDPAESQTASSDSPQMLGAEAPADLAQFNDLLENGQQFAKDLAEREAAKLRPLFAKFAHGAFTSGFGARWGVQHLGIDVAAPIGTPIYAVADGKVIDAGPAAGFGMWVRLLHSDGTITVYGHVDTTTVSAGQYVLAGDQIATMGNRGFSTGPHVHFEVWLNGSQKIDPVPWLATRGIGLNSGLD